MESLSNVSSMSPSGQENKFANISEKQLHSNTGSCLPVNLTEPLPYDMEYLFLLEFPNGAPFKTFYSHFHHVIGNPEIILEGSQNLFGFNSIAFCEFLMAYPEKFWVTKSPWESVLVFPPDVNNTLLTGDLGEIIWDKTKDLSEFRFSVLKPEDVSKVDLLGDMGEKNKRNWNEAFILYSYCCDKIREALVTNTAMFNSIPENTRRLMLKTGCKIVEMATDTKSDLELDEEIEKINQISTPKPIGLIYTKIIGLDVVLGVGDMVNCKGSCIYNPAKFYVTPKVCVADLEKLMTRMKKAYAISEGRNLNQRVWKGFMRPGFYVAVKRASQDDDDKQWYRGQILEKINDEIYRVQLVDYGEVINANDSDMRYLFHHFITEMKVAVVRCSAKLGENYPTKNSCKGSRFRWTPEETKVFKSLTDGENLGVHLREMRKIGEETSWNVIVHVLDENCRRIVLPHVEREVIRRVRGKYICGRKEYTEVRTNLLFPVPINLSDPII